MSNSDAGKQVARLRHVAVSGRYWATEVGMQAAALASDYDRGAMSAEWSAKATALLRKVTHE